jgi:hypothetical protein
MVHTRRTLRASVRRPTRSKNTNLSVNALLGEGFHGKTYRLGATVKGNSLSKILEHKHILKIKLYTSDSLEEVYLTEKEDIDEFVNFILSRKGAIAKVFKSIFLATGVTKQQDLEDELNVNRKIINLLQNFLIKL